MELRNQVVWVTGASHGIGRATAEAFAEEQAEVILTARSEVILRAMAHEFREHGFRTAVLPGDVAKEDVVERIADQIGKQFGRLDVLINSVGALTPRKLIHEVAAEEWGHSMMVNLRGAFLCARAALRLMLPDRKGVIVHLSSGAGRQPFAGWGTYCVAKAGIEMLTKVSAEDYRETGIRFYALDPGPTHTRMRSEAFPEEDPKTLKPPEKVAGFLLRLVRGDLTFPNGASVEYVDLA